MDRRSRVICCSYPKPIRLARRKSQLIAQRGRGAFEERPFQVKIGAIAVRQFHLTVDEFRDTRLESPRPLTFGWNDARHSRRDECPFRLREESRCIASLGGGLLPGATARRGERGQGGRRCKTKNQST